MTHKDLPQPCKSRWQPLRAGLVNIFLYDYEEFWFRDGHLLLRGNNGTGKSKVLALTLPFLLDGQITPARVEPDGDPGKRMEWNLLLGGRHSERLGYTWLEFGRLRDGGIETVTLGCGLKAVQGRGSLRTWFFMTDQRIGENLWLVGENDYPLSRERLMDALEGHGMVFDTAIRYRHAVDERLFQLDEERYNALINLLIQLRQPQLSKRPDPEKLSLALSEALPPLDQAVLSDVAEAFHILESERRELEGLRQAHQAVNRFRGHYRAYAQIAARRRVQTLRQAQSRCDKASSELNETRAQLADTTRRQQEMETHIAILADRLEETRNGEHALRASPEMRDAETLRRIEELAEEKAKMAEDAYRQQQQIERDLERRTVRLRERQTAIARSLPAVQATLTEIEGYAQRAGIEARHHQIMVALGLQGNEADSMAEEARIKEAEDQARALWSRRQRDMEYLKTLNQTLEQAQRSLHEARERLQRELDQAERLDEDRLQAEQRVVEQGTAHVEAFIRFADTARELRIAEPDAVASALGDWVNTLAGDSPAQLALTEAYRHGVQTVEEQRAEAKQARETIRNRHDELRAEQARLEAGEHARPPIPHTRNPDDRDERPGAPLWQLVDFHDGLPTQARAGLEAALESAGLLDAWVMPDGALLDPATWDAVLIPEAPVEDNLNQVLIPAVDHADPKAAVVADTVLRSILAGISRNADHPVRVNEQGRWRLGPVHGAWQKSQAQYIGRGARETARRHRLSELDTLLRETKAAMVQSDRILEGLTERRRLLETEWQMIPKDEALRHAHSRVTYLLDNRRQLQTRIDRAETAAVRAKEIVEQRTHERDQAANDLDLPPGTEALQTIAAALSDYRAASGAFWPQLRHHWDNGVALRIARDEYEEALRRLGQSAERVMEREQAVRAAAIQRDILRATVGEAVERLEQRLRETMRLIRELQAESQQAQGERVALANQLGTLTNKVESLQENLAREREQRREAIRTLQAFAADGLLVAAVPDCVFPERIDEWPVDLALRLARQVEQMLQGVDAEDAVWNRHQRGLHEHLTTLQSALSRHGHEASAEQTDSGLMVRIVFQVRSCSPDELAERLTAEEREREALLRGCEKIIGGVYYRVS
jgi:uncharacterized protein (TIGR02680 family)